MHDEAFQTRNYGAFHAPGRPRQIGRKPLELDRDAILQDRRRGQSLGQLAKAHRISRATVHRVLHAHAPPDQQQVA